MYRSPIKLNLKLGAFISSAEKIIIPNTVKVENSVAKYCLFYDFWKVVELKSYDFNNFEMPFRAVLLWSAEFS